MLAVIKDKYFVLAVLKSTFLMLAMLKMIYIVCSYGCIANASYVKPNI